VHYSRVLVKAIAVFIPQLFRLFSDLLLLSVINLAYDIDSGVMSSVRNLVQYCDAADADFMFQ